MSLTPNEFRQRVYEAFKTAWDIGPVSPYTFDNEGFDPPSPPKPGAPQSGTPWVRLVVRHGESNIKCIGRPGARKFENEARVVMQIFTVPDTGTSEADRLNQAFQNIFSRDLGRNDTFSGNSSYRERGTANGWQMAESTAEFTYDEVR